MTTSDSDDFRRMEIEAELPRTSVEFSSGDVIFPFDVHAAVEGVRHDSYGIDSVEAVERLRERAVHTARAAKIDAALADAAEAEYERRLALTDEKLTPAQRQVIMSVVADHPFGRIRARARISPADLVDD